jgi:hypothetical protein
MARRTASVAVKHLYYVVKAETMILEDKFYFQRFYPDDVVQLRGSEDRREGTVIRSCQMEDGGTKVVWDGKGDRVYLHNPRHLENVWEVK